MTIRPHKGHFVTFEGGEGAGKTTQTRRLADRLRDVRGEDVLVTREPGGSLIGNAIRSLLVSKAATGAMDARMDVLEVLQDQFEKGVIPQSLLTAYNNLILAAGHIRSPMTEALLHFAARAEHWEFAILPMLKQYSWVLCDRFSDSTMAYQGYAGGREQGGVGADRIAALAEVAIPGIKPDITFMLDLDPAQGLGRAEMRSSDASSYETLGLEYHQRVREGFLEIAAREPERCKIIDASLSEDAVADAIWSAMEKFLAKISAVA